MTPYSPEEIETIVAGNIADALAAEAEALTELSERVQAAVDRLTGAHDAKADDHA